MTLDLEAARKAGCNFYEDPATLNIENIDPLLRSTVRRINESGWVWTGESCQGHPDSPDWGTWAMNTKPMLRLICRQDDLGDMMRALVESLWVPFTISELDPPEHREAAYCAEIWPHVLKDGWSEVLVYIKARTVFERDQGIKAFAQFADLVVDGGVADDDFSGIVENIAARETSQ